MKMSAYSMGFLVSEDGQSVLLLEKNRPAFLAGKWMGLAGHIEPGETHLQAVARESAEEGDVHGVDWKYIKRIEHPEAVGAEIHAFMGRFDLSKANALTDERIQVFTWSELENLDLGVATLEVLSALKAFASLSPGCSSLARVKSHRP